MPGLEDFLSGLLFNQQPMQDQPQDLTGGAPPQAPPPPAPMPRPRPQSFDNRWSPVETALGSGTFDPVGMNNMPPRGGALAFTDQPLSRPRPDLPAEIAERPPLPSEIPTRPAVPGADSPPAADAVPLPRPRPGAAVIQDPSNPLGGAPYDEAPPAARSAAIPGLNADALPPRGTQPPASSFRPGALGDQRDIQPPMWGPNAPGSGGGVGGILNAIGGPKMLSRSLAGGLLSVKNSPFAGEVFAHGAGGALAGGNQYQDAQDASKTAALDRAIKLKGQDQTAAYRTGQLDLGHRNAATGEANSASLSALRAAQATKPGAWNKTPHQIRLDVDKYLQGENKEIDRKYGIGSRPAYGEEGAKRTAAAEAEKKALKAQKYKEYGLDENGMPAGGSRAPAGGAGPAAPGAPVTSREQYDALPAGARYQHPNDPPGQLRVKGGGDGATPAAPVPLGDGGEEDEDQ